MTPSEGKNSAIESSFRSLEDVFNKFSNLKARESNKLPLGHSERIEADLSEIEKAHLNLLQSRLNATIAQEQLEGMAESSGENRRFSRLLFALNFVIAASTMLYTWITWQSVRAMREGNEIQQQILQLQKPSVTTQSTPSPNP